MGRIRSLPLAMSLVITGPADADGAEGNNRLIQQETPNGQWTCVSVKRIRAPNQSARRAV